MFTSIHFFTINKKMQKKKNAKKKKKKKKINTINKKIKQKTIER